MTRRVEIIRDTEIEKHRDTEIEKRSDTERVNTLGRIGDGGCELHHCAQRRNSHCSIFEIKGNVSASVQTTKQQKGKKDASIRA